MEAGIILGFDPVFIKLSLRPSVAGWMGFEPVYQDISLEGKAPSKPMPLGGGGNEWMSCAVWMWERIRW